jgi:hypothetical protein
MFSRNNATWNVKFAISSSENTSEKHAKIAGKMTTRRQGPKVVQIRNSVKLQGAPWAYGMPRR